MVRTAVRFATAMVLVVAGTILLVATGHSTAAPAVPAAPAARALPPGAASPAVRQAPGGRGAQAAVVAPSPPVDAADFPVAPRGAALADGTALIPNPASPLGSLAVRSARCDRTFDATKGATAAQVDALVAKVENRLTSRYVVCLAGTFTEPIHVDGKYSAALLTVQPAPGRTAAFHLGTATAGEADPNEFTGATGGIAIVDSRSVEVVGIAVSGLHAAGTAVTPAGIYVTVRGASEGSGSGGHASACFEHGDRFCGDVYLIDDTVTDIANTADEVANRRAWCDNSSVDAFGIAVESFGTGEAEALRHVVIEGDTVAHTRTGQSESLTVNGDVEDFLVARTRVFDTDNIGIVTIGWESGTGQARHGIVEDDTVANVDTASNRAYGTWQGGTCRPLPENAAGIYDDGGSYVWIADDVVDNSNQGIDLDVETPKRWTDHLLVTDDVVVDDPGSSLGVPSAGHNPPGVPGPSANGGHAFEAFYVDSYGGGSRIEDVYAHGNHFENESQYYGGTSRQAAPVIDVAGHWSHVVLFDNTVTGGGTADRRNALVEVDNRPSTPAGTVLDCTTYLGLSTVAANFVAPGGASYRTLAAWQAHNGWGWDAHSATGDPHCPAALP